MIEIDRVNGGYQDVPVVHDIDVKTEAGTFFGLLGPNGSGKTTLFKLMSGALAPMSGDVRLSGTSLLHMTQLQRARRVAVLAQETHVSFDFTVEEIVRLGRYAFQKGVLKRMSREDQAAVEEALEVTSTTSYRDRPFYQLSGGEKQRVLLAKAFVQEPELLLLDEPTNHLDIRHTFDILDVLKRWQQEKGLTIFAILHDVNIAALYCDQVGLMHEGRLVEQGTVDILQRRERLSSIYGVEAWTQPHPAVARPQLLMNPPDIKERSMSLLEDHQLTCTDEVIHLTFPRPLRTVSNGVAGEGVQWIRHFANFHVDHYYNSMSPKEDVETWLEALGCRKEQSLGMMTAVQLSQAEICMETLFGIDFLVIVTAGTGNAVDITNRQPELEPWHAGTINTLVFCDLHLSDGGLMNASMSAVEAKVRALQDEGIMDHAAGTPATSTSTDSLVIAATQQGERTAYAGSGTAAGKGIGRLVYETTRKAVRRYNGGKP
ncbi:adenosylcobinamide amidohydrolase [Alkalicoccus chagannorensis]|uniref:adenosylcobinamide amidohydrolase n=1 Tax=Alkalicoccus chagannorensis TaxID=427072 RepID=UPI0003FB126C|nr:adenosylcobinamide amidohydrolase [Alkalicoccus chagannorensis]